MNDYVLWCCRRGVLELDLLLERFVRQRYDKLDDTGKQLFQSLLQCEDSWLQAWLLYQTKPVPQAYQSMVDSIKQFS